MEKTIEERAITAYPNWTSGGISITQNKREGYVRGATEQKEIDDANLEIETRNAWHLGYNDCQKLMIKKVSEWLRENYSNYNFEDGFDESIIDDITKAMEN